MSPNLAIVYCVSITITVLNLEVEIVKLIYDEKVSSLMGEVGNDNEPKLVSH
jgi:hypothetical protein